jgi:hypothetical protein
MRQVADGGGWAGGRWQVMADAGDRWQMADGRWRISGRWQVAGDGRWQMADGRWQVTVIWHSRSPVYNQQ